MLTYSLGLSLASSLEKAIKMQKAHCQAFEDHNKTFDAIMITKWTKMVEDWEADSQMPNPFEEPETCECNNRII